MSLDFATNGSADSNDETAKEPAAESLEDLRSMNAARVAEALVDDEANRDEDMELPGADLSDMELVVAVVPKQADEFTCTRCFLILHQTRRVAAGVDVCQDCD